MSVTTLATSAESPAPTAPASTAPASTAPASTAPASTAPARTAGSTRTENHYTAIAKLIKDGGLLTRTRRFYLLLFTGLVLAVGGVVTGIILLGDSWLQLLMAAALGVVFTQFAFIGHEASHRQVVASGKSNDRIGWLLAIVCVGISYSWWMNKHTRHHGNPNTVGKDPDIEIDTVSFTAADAATRKGVMAWVTRHQGVFFFPLLLGEGANLHLKSFRYLWSKRTERTYAVELAVLVARFALYFGAVFWLLPLGMAFAFLGLQLAVFGLYMGASFAPNHIGMRIIKRGTKLDFFSKQVLTSRNVAGGWWMTVLMGGLNYQVEHHLFPSMPRPHLAAARRLVREHCRKTDTTYTETSLGAAWAIVIGYLNEVGLNAPAAFRCPVLTELR